MKGKKYKQEPKHNPQKLTAMLAQAFRFMTTTHSGENGASRDGGL